MISRQHLSSEQLRRAGEEFIALRASLEEYHGIFYEIFDMGIPVFTDETETAAIGFDKEHGICLEFLWNYDFWNFCNTYERTFITCHEVLHVLFNHGRRINGLEDKGDIPNIAADLVVNHTLVNRLGFDRSKIEFADRLTWIDTVWPEPEKIESDREMEYYYNMLVANAEQIKVPAMGISDDHSRLPGGSDDSEENQEAIDKMIQNLDDDTKDEFFKAIEDHREVSSGAGKQAGDRCYVPPKKKPKYNMKWTDVIKEWRKTKAPDNGPEEIWHTPARRFFYLSGDKGFILPHEVPYEDYAEEKEKITVWFYQDTSGSCTSWADKFFHAAKTFPPDKFDVRAFCFDTKVYEIDLENCELKGFGGTAFRPLEGNIQRLMEKEKIKYPDAVFVFTDGCAWDKVNPEHPDRWYWFLQGNYKNCIPPGSFTFKLDDFIN
jgi:hypothetical protein